MDKQKQPPSTPYVRVNVVLDNQTLPMADEMYVIRELENRSVYIRNLIKADYRREQRRQQRLQVTA